MHCLNIVFACSSIAENELAKAKFMKTHTKEQCVALGLRVEYSTDKKIFTEEDDLLIGELEGEMGSKWGEIALLVPGERSGQEIANRFRSVHRVRLSGESSAKYKKHRDWTKEEDQIIRDGIAEPGNKWGKWKIIAELLGDDRDVKSVMSRVNSKAFKKAAAASVSDESTVVVPRAAKKVKVAIPPTCVDGGVAGVLNGGPPPLELSLSSPVPHAGVAGVLNGGPSPLELSLSSPVPHADIDSFAFTISNVDFDENDDTVVDYLIHCNL
jgi:hypothetical protein